MSIKYNTRYFPPIPVLNLTLVTDSAKRGEVHPITFYLVDLKIDKILLPGILIAGDAHSTEIVIGRDVLNKLPLFLDGAVQQTELLDDAVVNRIRARRTPE